MDRITAGDRIRRPSSRDATCLASYRACTLHDHAEVDYIWVLVDGQCEPSTWRADEWERVPDWHNQHLTPEVLDRLR